MADKLCDCGGRFAHTGMQLCSLPPFDVYRCEKCGKELNVRQAPPRKIYLQDDRPIEPPA